MLYTDGFIGIREQVEGTSEECEAIALVRNYTNTRR